jgi:flagellar motor switch protein FliM
MTKEELDKKIEEAKKHSEVLSQEQIDELLKAIEAGEDDFRPVNDYRKIKIYDFKRPDKFSKYELRTISCASETFAREVRKFLTSEYDITAKIHVASVDQLTFEEHLRALPTPQPFCTFKWNEGTGMLCVNPCLFFNGFLGGSIKNNSYPNSRDLNGLEQKIFTEYIYKPLAKILHTTFSAEAGVTLPEITDEKYDCNPQFAYNVSQPSGIGVLITFEVKIGKTEDFINLFFNADFVESLRKTRLFKTEGVPNFVPLPNPEPNTIVEAGRFRLEDGETLKEKYVYELNHLAGTALHIYKDGNYVGSGEAVVIDNDISAVRVVTKQDEIEERTDDGFYNTKVIFGSRIVKDDYKFDEGNILELVECISDPLKIIKNNKIIGYGELVILDESFAVKVTKVL